MKYLLNAFSINMLSSLTTSVNFEEVTLQDAKELAHNVQSAIGHADTAAVVADVLEQPVESNRVSVTLDEGDKALVAQYIGPRLEEGATKLPAGATIKFVVVTIA